MDLHVTEALEAEGAVVFVLGQVFKAGLVESVAALEENRLLGGVELLCQADGALLPYRVFNALVVISNRI